MAHIQQVGQREDKTTRRKPRKKRRFRDKSRENAMLHGSDVKGRDEIKEKLSGTMKRQPGQ